MVRKKTGIKKEDSGDQHTMYYIFYSQERWNNWIQSLCDADFSENGDNEDELPSGFLILNGFYDDITVSTIKIIRLYQKEKLTLGEAHTRIRNIEDIVMGSEPSGELAEIIGSMQISLLVLFASAHKYLENIFMDGNDVKNMIQTGRKTFKNDPEKALDIASTIGSTVINDSTSCKTYVKNVANPTPYDDWMVEIERIISALKSLKFFDEDMSISK